MLMLRICLKCSLEYDGDPGSITCPQCAAEERKTTIRQRTCRDCGADFPGGPRAWRCPDCRRAIKLERDREHKRRGAARKLGSTDLCKVCGAPYTVESGLQRYCKDCAPEVVRAIDRAQSRAWQAEHTTPDQRREARDKATAEIRCVICGAWFKPSFSAKTCSKGCSIALRKQHMREAEKRRPPRNRKKETNHD